MRIHFGVLSFVFFFSLPGWLFAQVWDPTAGPEFTLSHPALYSENDGVGPNTLEVHKRLHEHLTKLCSYRTGPSACKVVDVSGEAYPKFRVEYANIEVGNPPQKLRVDYGIDHAVMEIQTSPMIESEWDLHEKLLQEDIFDQPAKLGLEPNPKLGNGHLNLGLESTFGKNDDLVMDFLIDLANHPELGMGIFGMEDVRNAPVLARLNLEQRKAFAELAHLQQSGKISSRKELITRLRYQVYRASPQDLVQPRKYQAVNVETVGNPNVPLPEQRVELRSMQAPKNVREFIMRFKLLKGRIAFLKRNIDAGKRAIFIDAPIIKKPQTGVNRFRAYVEEASLPWAGKNGFQHLVADDWKPFVKNAQPLRHVTPGPAAIVDCSGPGGLLKAIGGAR